MLLIRPLVSDELVDVGEQLSKPGPLRPEGEDGSGVSSRPLLKFLCAQPADREDFNFVQVFRGNFSSAGEGSDFFSSVENFSRAAWCLHLEPLRS